MRKKDASSSSSSSHILGRAFITLLREEDEEEDRTTEKNFHRVFHKVRKPFLGLSQNFLNKIQFKQARIYFPFLFTFGLCWSQWWRRMRLNASIHSSVPRQASFERREKEGEKERGWAVLLLFLLLLPGRERAICEVTMGSLLAKGWNGQSDHQGDVGHNGRPLGRRGDGGIVHHRENFLFPSPPPPSSTHPRSGQDIMERGGGGGGKLPIYVGITMAS